MIDHPTVIQRILRPLGLPTEIPDVRPARSPPIPLREGSMARAGADELVYDHDEPA